MKRVKRHPGLRKVKPPEVVLARQMEQMMVDAGMPKPWTKADFKAYHDRLYATDLVYRSAHGELCRLLKAKRERQ